MDVVERYKDYLDFFLVKTIDLLNVVDSYMDSVTGVLKYLHSWFNNILGKVGRRKIINRILEDLLYSEEVLIDLHNILPIAYFYYSNNPRGVAMDFVHNKIELKYDKDLDGLYLVCGFVGDLYSNGDASPNTMLPEVLLYILSLHSDKSTSDIIKSIFEDVGIIDVFDGITITFTPVYGLTEHIYKHFNGKLDVELTFTERNNICIYLSDALKKMEVYNFDKYLGKQRCIEEAFFAEHIFYEYRVGSWRTEYIELNLCQEKDYISIFTSDFYEMRPIDLVRLIDLAISGMAYYYIVLGKIYENVLRKH